jgi:hypothetical protein
MIGLCRWFCVYGFFFPGWRGSRSKSSIELQLIRAVGIVAHSWRGRRLPTLVELVFFFLHEAHFSNRFKRVDLDTVKLQPLGLSNTFCILSELLPKEILLDFWL